MTFITSAPVHTHNEEIYTLILKGNKKGLVFFVSCWTCVRGYRRSNLCTIGAQDISQLFRQVHGA